MKAGREHRVPLSNQAVSILKELKDVADGEIVFGPKAKEAAVKYGNGNGAAAHEDCGRHCPRLPVKF